MDSTEQTGAFSANHFLTVVTPRELEKWLLVCLPVLVAALAKTEDYTFREVAEGLRAGDYALLVEMFEGRPQMCMVVSSLEEGPFHIMALAGFPDRIIAFPNTSSLELVKAHAQAMGCVSIQAHCSAAGARLWATTGAVEVYRLMRIEL